MRTSKKLLIVLCTLVVVCLALVVGCAQQGGSSASASAEASSSAEPEPAANDAAAAAESEDAEAAETGAASTASTGGTLGNATVDYFPSGSWKSELSRLPDAVNDNLDAENAVTNAPRIRTTRDGFTVQDVPDDGMGWNISYLNADSRGCTSCHSLEEALFSMPTYHGIILNGYPVEQNFSTCIQCHIWAAPLKDSLHSLHTRSSSFNALGGTCESCHYIGKGEDFQIWDYKKYQLYKGITDVDAQTVDFKVDYDQETVSDIDEMFYKSIKVYGDPTSKDWRTNDGEEDPDLFDNWVFTVDGEVENPISMTLPELVEQFGTETHKLKGQCTINGYGDAMIFQAEVTGVPVKKILEYVKPAENWNSLDIESEDEYPNVGVNYHFPRSVTDVDDALIAIEVNGETLPNSQGYPCTFWIPRTSNGCNVKVCTGFTVLETTEEDAATGLWVGGFVDENNPETGAKPNAGVLNMPTGIVVAPGEAVELEGYADGFDEAITKVEYSFDHGETWVEMETPNSDPTRWVYWRATFNPPAEGAYLLQIRSTSVDADGEEHVCPHDTEFLINVKNV